MDVKVLVTVGSAIVALALGAAEIKDRVQTSSTSGASMGRYLRDRPAGKGAYESVPIEFAEPETLQDRLRAQRLADEGDDKAAEAAYRDTLTKHPTSSLTYVELAAVLQREKRGDEEWDAALKAYELAPRSPLAVAAVAIGAGYRKEHKIAISWYSRAIDLDSNYGLAYYGRGLEHYRIGEFSESIPDFRRVVYLMPGSKYSSEATRYLGLAERELNSHRPATVVEKK